MAETDFRRAVREVDWALPPGSGFSLGIFMANRESRNDATGWQKCYDEVKSLPGGRSGFAFYPGLRLW